MRWRLQTLCAGAGTLWTLFLGFLLLLLLLVLTKHTSGSCISRHPA